MPPAYQRFNNYAQSGHDKTARHMTCGSPTAGDLGPGNQFR
jgi:hypothetical protein